MAPECSIIRRCPSLRRSTIRRAVKIWIFSSLRERLEFWVWLSWWRCGPTDRQHRVTKLVFRLLFPSMNVWVIVLVAVIRGTPRLTVSPAKSVFLLCMVQVKFALGVLQAICNTVLRNVQMVCVWNRPLGKRTRLVMPVTVVPRDSLPVMTNAKHRVATKPVLSVVNAASSIAGAAKPAVPMFVRSKVTTQTELIIRSTSGRRFKTFVVSAMSYSSRISWKWGIVFVPRSPIWLLMSVFRAAKTQCAVTWFAAKQLHVIHPVTVRQRWIVHGVAGKKLPRGYSSR